ncbi:hypothetical protein [Salinigranum sp. GCM10025319]|uniref:hypothetical protein n=1 Tax=Salinigranum sp. GCM10025319 TaxID=3252687 RepID=UPI0036112668
MVDLPRVLFGEACDRPGCEEPCPYDRPAIVLDGEAICCSPDCALAVAASLDEPPGRVLLHDPEFAVDRERIDGAVINVDVPRTVFPGESIDEAIRQVAGLYPGSFTAWRPGGSPTADASADGAGVTDDGSDATDTAFDATSGRSDGTDGSHGDDDHGTDEENGSRGRAGHDGHGGQTVPKPAVFVYAPDGTELLADVTPADGQHVPRVGEMLSVTDHTGEGVQRYPPDETLRVADVETEYRLVDTVDGGTAWQQLVYVHTTGDGAVDDG